jgi:hypothetical protein
MFNRLALVLAVSVLVSTPRLVVADPITYDFTGTFSQPFDGSKTFNGSLTFNATPTTGDSSDSLTVNVGGQVLTFSNSPQNPNVSLTVGADVEPNTTTPTVEFSFVGSIEGNDTSRTFGVTMYDYGLGAVPSNLASLNLPLYTSTALLQEITVNNSTGEVESVTGGSGVLTSYEAVSTPEPSTVVIFAGLALAAIVRGHRRGSRGRGQQA